MWGIWDKNNKEFARHYELHYDEDAVRRLQELPEDIWLEGGEEVEKIEADAEPVSSLHLFQYENYIDACIELCERWPYSNLNYEVKEIPENEPEWEDI